MGKLWWNEKVIKCDVCNSNIKFIRDVATEESEGATFVLESGVQLTLCVKCLETLAGPDSLEAKKILKKIDKIIKKIDKIIKNKGGKPDNGRYTMRSL